jgi:hypothetical protein
MTNKPGKLTLREHALVTKREMMCDDHASTQYFFKALLNEDVECIPLEGTPGMSITFATAVDGKAYTITYRTEVVIDGSKITDLYRIVNAAIVRSPEYDMMPREYHQYRITFHKGAEERMTPLELAWLFSKYDVEIVAKSDYKPMVMVKAPSRSNLYRFMCDVNNDFGSLIFCSVEGAGANGYEEIDFS